MARGRPILWSALFGLLFIISGTYTYFGQNYAPGGIGLPFITFSIFIMTVGTYIEYVAAPDKPDMHEGEAIIDTRSPVQRAAVVKMIIGVSALGVFLYLYLLTFLPYIYPIAALITGLYLFSTGLFAYWTNTLTTYYITNQRFIKEYRFISLVRQELRLNKVRGVEESKSIWEALVGLGNVQVFSGGGQSLQITAQNIFKSTSFADQIRKLLSDRRPDNGESIEPIINGSTHTEPGNKNEQSDDVSAKAEDSNEMQNGSDGSDGHTDIPTESVSDEQQVEETKNNTENTDEPQSEQETELD
jgi:hypothetical protein